MPRPGIGNACSGGRSCCSSAAVTRARFLMLAFSLHCVRQVVASLEVRVSIGPDVLPQVVVFAEVRTTRHRAIVWEGLKALGRRIVCTEVRTLSSVIGSAPIFAVFRTGSVLGLAPLVHSWVGALVHSCTGSVLGLAPLNQIGSVLRPGLAPLFALAQFLGWRP